MIAILGLGHVGSPLREALSQKYLVTGTTTSAGKLMDSVYLWHWGSLFPLEMTRAEQYIITIPPRHINPMDFSFLEQKPLIYLSSISVYGDFQGVVNELTPPVPNTLEGSLQLQCEQNLLKTHPEATILRLGGLLGPTRHPGTYLSGKKNLDRAKAPVNLVWVHDVIKVILNLIESPKPGEVINVVSDEHPTRQEFYSEFCQKKGLPLPEFTGEEKKTKDKLVTSLKLKERFKLVI